MAARFKGFQKLAHAMDRHIHLRRKQFTSYSSDLVIRLDSGEPISLDATCVKKVIRALPEGPLNTQRERAVDNLTAELWAVDYRRRMVANRAASPLTRKEFSKRLRQELERQIDGFWPKLDFRKEYRTLLSDGPVLAAATNCQTGDRECSALSASLPRNPNTFGDEDLGALCYLDHLLNECHNTKFDLVVIDEAQETSLMEFLVMQSHTKANGFTILGDLAQSVSPQGIENWRQVLRLFPAAEVSKHLMRESYRSTAAITKYANRVLKRAVPRATTAVPYQRHGPKPVFSRSRSYGEMVLEIAADIRRLKAQGDIQSIGILCKNGSQANKLGKALRNQGIDLGLLNGKDTTSAAVVVSPIHLTRGLEYDAVILSGADRENYVSTSLHNKLLYLGVTVLHMYCTSIGKVTWRHNWQSTEVSLIGNNQTVVTIDNPNNLAFDRFTPHARGDDFRKFSAASRRRGCPSGCN